jgi:coenzyme F420 hydrogenase subunit beta
MATEKDLTWEFLHSVNETLDSYRVRALIDAKKDILEAGIYNEAQYYDILFKMFDEERLKYALYDFLKDNKDSNLEGMKKYSQENSLELNKVLSYVELLKNEKLIKVEEIYDKIEGDENTPDKFIFKDITITILEIEGNDVSKIRPIYEPVKVIFDSHVCSGCGMCEGICPVNCITLSNGIGKIDDDKCIRCGLCYFVCPRSYLPIKVLNMTQEGASEIKDYGKVGYFKEACVAQTKVKEISEVCQDGGISSTALHYLFKKGLIDLAFGAKMSEDPWRPEPMMLEKKEDIITTAGTKYVNNPNLKLLKEKGLDDKKLAVVGVPCQMQALLKSNIYNIGIPSHNNVEYRIGIFCMESFLYGGLLKIYETLNIDAKDVKKTDINKGKFFVYPKNGEPLSIPIKEINHLARHDCEFCFDLTSESADISVGSIGAPAGWNMVLIRTEKGKELYDGLIKEGLIESKDVKDVKPGLPMLQKIANIKKNGCKKHIAAKKEANNRYPEY